MRRLLVVVLLAAALATCGGDDGDEAAGPQRRTVLVDFRHDEMAASFLQYFPRNVVVRPGDTVVFEQQWTGDPHTVTLGARFDEIVGEVPELRSWVKEGGPLPVEQVGAEALAEVQEELAGLPSGITPTSQAIQPAAQPCFLDTGLPPIHPDIPCPEDKQVQVPFDGTQTYYNSGFIPYEGEGANRFEVPLADDIEPGDYAYYCAVHGLSQSGVVTVEEPDADIPSQSEVDRTARRELEASAEPLREALEGAQRGETEAVLGKDVTENLAGWEAAEEVPAFLDEFIPRRIEARVGEKVTWRFLGPHTVSFNVPEYVPIFTSDPTGKVTINPDIYQPIGGPGAPPLESLPPQLPPDGRLPPDLEIDSGTWNGNGFLSSGLFFSLGNLLYSITFTEAGTYQYACLIHPQMIGEIEVS